MKKLFIILAITLFSCTSELDFPIGNEVVVVEGWVTTQEKQHWVKLSKTVGFQDAQSEEAIENATVVIEDNVSPTTYALTHSSDGVYLSDSFSGVIGRQYTLTIVLENDDVITSTSQRLSQVPDIDDIVFDSFIENDPDTGDDVEIFFPVVTTTDLSEEPNYYRYKGYRNGELLNLPSEMEILSDRFLKPGELLDHSIPTFRYQIGDVVQVELLSLSSDAFDFLDLLKSQTTSLGSSSGTAPATLIGNLSYESKSEIVLGFFGASDVKSISATVE
ncbi:MAG: DUF4249 domain-containing protein [Cyclobacteriaceae bacterium]